MNQFEKLQRDPRVVVRRSGAAVADAKCVVYWMERSQRAEDNPALDVAVMLANELQVPAVVFFAPVPSYPSVNIRHLRFLADGVQDIAAGLARRGVGLVFRPYREHSLLKFCDQVKPAIVIGDENPLRHGEKARSKVAKALRIPFWTVDADVIVPSRLLAKEHYGARTIRPVIQRLMPEFLAGSKNPRARVEWKKTKAIFSAPIDVDFLETWRVDRSVAAVASWRGGTREAKRRLSEFLKRRLDTYPRDRNHPECRGTSELSPYLHFGHIGPHTVALGVQRSDASRTAKAAFLEQLIVRRELAINFVRFNPDYDNADSMEPWAARSFATHARDRRAVVYSEAQLEKAETHDPLWNAAQMQMVKTGWMHNYLRMYWAKKILEWSPGPSVAFEQAVYLNDKYEIDGRDPNGYAGIAWAIVGKHDRAWFDRPVFGQIRYMSLKSTGSKFDSKKYIENVRLMSAE